MSDLNVQLCPETGICSIIKEDGSKVDLMPFEVDELKGALDDGDAVKATISNASADFAEALSAEEIAQLKSALS